MTGLEGDGRRQGEQADLGPAVAQFQRFVQVGLGGVVVLQCGERSCPRPVNLGQLAAEAAVQRVGHQGPAGVVQCLRPLPFGLAQISQRLERRPVVRELLDEPFSGREGGGHAIPVPQDQEQLLVRLQQVRGKLGRLLVTCLRVRL